MNSKIYNVPEIGMVTISKHHMAKRIILKIKPDKTATVTIPKLMPYQMGMQFILEKKEWVIKHQKKIDSTDVIDQLYSTNSVIKTRFSKIKVQHFKGGKVDSFYKDGCYHLSFPIGTDLTLDSNQKTIKAYIVEILRKEAKAYLPERTLTLAERYGFNVKKVFIKNLKSRWGSCSSENNVNLNLHLMRLPEYLSDFIILHELCHTVHMNHGKDFHRLLNHLVKDEKQLNKELKKYNIHL